MKKAVMLLTLALTGCAKTEYGEQLQEPAEVSDVVFTPSQHGSGTGLGFGANGNVSVVVTDVDMPPVYAVVFQCQHGKFIVKDKFQWEMRKPGETVTVIYREVYKVKGSKRILHDYDFITAVAR